MKKYVLGIVFVLLIIVFGFIFLDRSHQYNEDDITSELCISLLETKENVTCPIEIVGIEKVGNSIIAGYVVGGENEMNQMGYLVFEFTDGNYTYKKNQSKMSRSALDIQTSIYSSVVEGNVEQYLVVISNNSNLEKIVIFEEDQIIGIEKIETTPDMCITGYPQSGRYVFYDKFDNEI